MGEGHARAAFDTESSRLAPQERETPSGRTASSNNASHSNSYILRGKNVSYHRKAQNLHRTLDCVLTHPLSSGCFGPGNRRFLVVCGSAGIIFVLFQIILSCAVSCFLRRKMRLGKNPLFVVININKKYTDFCPPECLPKAKTAKPQVSCFLKKKSARQGDAAARSSH